ncbi:MAG: recombinase family protein [Defluviitaleaceae bacterium]|nr:recombinase family protein [Defluviitaleaceae bacterium]
MTKQTILYSRLSKEDERVNESLSIENQKAFLEEYANRNGYSNFVHLSDDGWSGTRWDRPGFLQMLDMVENGRVAQICIKDMSRLGRDHLRVGLFLEQLRESGVALIAVAESIDTSKGEDDFMPFRNLFAEWHARDTSRKIRAIFGARTKNGNHVSGAVPYGYIHDPTDRQKWILDEAAAPIVKRLFRGIIEGKSPTQLANELSAEGVLTPAAHWNKSGMGMPGKTTANPTNWAVGTILHILSKEEYTGKKILNKTTKESYKTKKRQPNPDGRLVFDGAIPAIITEEEWTVVQRLRETRRRPQRATGEANPLTGTLYCADCGHKMYNKIGKTGRENKPHDEYVCSSYRHYSRSCTCHYIRVEVVEQLLLDTIRRVSDFARNNEAEFIERVRQESTLQQETAVKENKKTLKKSQRRREEITGLVRKLYETYAAGKIPESHFADLLKSYDTEQTDLDIEIEKLQADINTFNADSVKAERFMELVKKHTEFTEFSPLLLNEFIEKVIVHEADKSTGKRIQKVDIYLNFIGSFDLPQAEKPQEELPKTLSRGRKPRHLMTEEEKEALRDYDRERYAKKKAARLAKEQAQRDEILAGTSFETVAKVSSQGLAKTSSQGINLKSIKIAI